MLDVIRLSLTHSLYALYFTLTTTYYVQELDTEYAAGLHRTAVCSEEIDTAINGISSSIDNLHSIGSAMKDEVQSNPVHFHNVNMVHYLFADNVLLCCDCTT